MTFAPKRHPINIENESSLLDFPILKVGEFLIILIFFFLQFKKALLKSKTLLKL